MKLFSFLFLLICQVGFCQRKQNQNSAIDIKGNSNIIRVIQADKVVVYDLKDEAQSKLLLKYLNSFPQLNRDIKTIFNNTKKIIELITKKNENGIFSKEDFFNQLEKYIQENLKLKEQNEELKNKTTDPDFAKALEEANKKLQQFDDKGYQDVLERYKNSKKRIIDNALKSVANASYLQAQNSNSNYDFTTGLVQINDALKYDSNNVNYILLKSDLLNDLSRFQESLTLLLNNKLLAADDSTSCIINDQIGITYYELSNYDSAFSYINKSLAMIKDSTKYGSWPAESYNIIGLIFYEKEDYDNALKYYRKAIITWQKLSGNNDKEPVYTLNMAVSFKSKGQIDTALICDNTALEIYKKKGDTLNPDVATIYSNLGLIYEDKHEFDKCLAYAKKSLALRSKLFGEVSEDCANSYNNLGSFFESQKQYDSALIYYKRALLILQYIFTKGHTYSAAILGNIGDVFNQKKVYDSAIVYYTRALEMNNQIFGDSSTNSGNVYFEIGLTYFSTGDYQKALKNDSIALTIFNKYYPPGNSTSQFLVHKMATIYIIQGNKIQGLHWLTKLDNLDYVNAQKLNTDGDELYFRKKYAESIKVYSVAAELLENINTKEAKMLRLTLYENMAISYCNMGNHEKAVELFDKTLAFANEIKDAGVDTSDIKKNYEACK